MCNISLLPFFHQLITSRDKIDVIYAYVVRLCKAFDSMPHNELLVKLWNINIAGSYSLEMV